MDGNLFSATSMTVPVSLSVLTAKISHTVNSSSELTGVWVTAELSDVRVNAGHCYMELVEKNQAGQTIAKLRATIWQSAFSNIRRQFLQATGKEIATGMKMMLKGNTTHHPLYGLSFNVTAIDPSYTLGDIERIRREILLKLHSLGVADNNKKLTIPPLPQRIAVISAEAAAGYGDFMNQLTGNSEGFVFYPFLIPAVMQGERVALSVRQALDFVESTFDLWDCVVILRGGGATTDLIGFDNYELAERVATFPLPVVVGIGHERDRNVLDEIAHTRVKTPTAAAAFFIDCARNAYDAVMNSMNQISRYAKDRITGENMKLSGISVALPAMATSLLNKVKGEIEKEMTRLPVLLDGRFNRERMRITSFVPFIKSINEGKIALYSKGVESLKERLTTVLTNKLELESQKLENLKGIVEVLSPGNTLKRGYAMVWKDGKTVTKTSDVAKGDRLKVQLYAGTIDTIAE